MTRLMVLLVAALTLQGCDMETKAGDSCKAEGVGSRTCGDGDVLHCVPSSAGGSWELLENCPRGSDCDLDSFACESTSGGGGGTCCKRCGTTSKPCGDSCIPKANTCHQGPGCAC